MPQRFVLAILFLAFTLSGCDSVVKNSPGTAGQESSTSAPSQTPDLGILKPHDRLGPEEPLPNSPIASLDDLYGWLAWQLQELSESEQPNNQLAVIETARKFTARLEKLRGMRIRLALPVAFVGEQDRDVFYRIAKEIGLPLPPVTEQDFVARFQEIDLSRFHRPMTSSEASLLPHDPFNVKLIVTPFVEAIPPYRLRFSNENSKSLMGMSPVGTLLAAQQQSGSIGKAPLVLEARIHFSEYDADLPQNGFDGKIRNRRISLILSSVKFIDEPSASHPLYGTDLITPHETMRDLAKTGTFFGNKADEEARESVVALGAARSATSGPITFRIAKVTAEGAFVDPWTISTSERNFPLNSSTATWHWRFTPLLLPPPNAVEQTSLQQAETDLLPLALVLTPEQLAAIKPGSFLCVAAKLHATGLYDHAKNERYAWLTEVKPLGLFSPDGTPLPLPSGPELPRAEADRTTKLKELQRSPLPAISTDNQPRPQKAHRIHDFTGAMRYLSGDLASATVDNDAVAYREAYEEFLARVEPLLGSQIRWRIDISLQANHLEIRGEDFPTSLPPAEQQGFWSSETSRARLSKGMARIRLHPFITIQDRPYESICFQESKGLRGETHVGYYTGKVTGLVGSPESLYRMVPDREIDDATFQAMPRKNSAWDVDGTLHSIIPWYVNLLDRASSDGPLHEVHFIVVITRARLQPMQPGPLDCPHWWDQWFTSDRIDSLTTLTPARLMVEPTRNRALLEEAQKSLEQNLAFNILRSYPNPPQPPATVRLITLPVHSDDGKRIHCKPWRILLPGANGFQGELTLHCQFTNADELPPKSPRDVPRDKCLPALDMWRVADSPLRTDGQRFAENDLVTFCGRLESTIVLPFDWEVGTPHAVFQFTGVRLIDHLPADGDVAPVLIDDLDLRTKAELKAAGERVVPEDRGRSSKSK